MACVANAQSFSRQWIFMDFHAFNWKNGNNRWIVIPHKWAKNSTTNRWSKLNCLIMVACISGLEILYTLLWITSDGLMRLTLKWLTKTNGHSYAGALKSSNGKCPFRILSLPVAAISIVLSAMDCTYIECFRFYAKCTVRSAFAFQSVELWLQSHTRCISLAGNVICSDSTLIQLFATYFVPVEINRGYRLLA